MFFEPVISFGLTSPAMLAWLAAAAAPLLIHLFSRRRYRETAWAAMEYLAAAIRKSRRRTRLEQLLLLAVRTLVVALAVLAVAEPYLENGGFAFAPGGVRTHRVLVVDGSYSMSCKDEEGAARFERAKVIARRLVEDSPAGDGFTLVLMSAPPRVIVGTPALEPDAFLAELDELDVSQTTFDLSATVQLVEEVLAESRRDTPGLARAEVYFFTDLGKVGWQPRFSGAAGENAFHQSMRRLAKAAEPAVVDVGQADVDNRAVTDVRVEEPFATISKPVKITATVKNFGSRPAANLGVELRIDGRTTARRNVELAAGGSAAVGFSHIFSTPGEHAIEIRIGSDRLDVDNRRWLAISVKPCLRVLCVDGDPAGGIMGGGATAYLKAALAPQNGKAEPARVCPEIEPESRLMELDLARYDCVFICNVAQFTTSEAKALGRYVEDGGGLVFFLGDRVLADRYNRRLGESGQEETRLLPARLDEPILNRQKGLDPLDYQHPIVEKFRGRERAGLLNTPVGKLFGLSLSKDSEANVVLAVRGEGSVAAAPLIVEEPIGRGRVVLVATSADTSWGPMPLWPSFVPLVHEILAYAVGGQIADRNLIVGDKLEGPDVDTTASGVYTAESVSAKGGNEAADKAEEKPASSRVYAVNVDTVESDLTKLSEAQLRGGAFAGIPVEYQTTWSQSVSAALSPMASRGQLAAAFLYAVFALLLLETFLAWRFGHHA